MKSHYLSSLLLAFSISGASLSAATTVESSGRTYINQGLVGVGRIPADTKDKFGETFGSFSAFAFQPYTWVRHNDGSYSGTLITQPDRGYNVNNTSNYSPRFNKITVAFTPATQSTSQNQVALTLADTIRYTDPEGTLFTSLDPLPTGTGKVVTGFPALPLAHNGRLSLDAEGIVVNADGSQWVSDEYGPYIFKFDATGKLIKAIRPPDAVIPRRSGADSFASNTPGVGQPSPSPANPTTGRQNNQGLEGLSISPDGRTLLALLQSATRQDGGTGGSGPRRYTRLFAYDLTTAEPTLKAEFVVELPTYTNGSNTVVPAQSEMVAISDTQFLVLARDGSGRGNSSVTSLYRRVLVYDLNGATNIAGTSYDSPATPIAPGGVLVSSLTPARGVTLVDMNDATELSKFGLVNGPTNSVNNLSEKWEAMALVPSLDPTTPNDWFLFVGNDNDFITTLGYQDGAAYAAALENDSMILVYRLTLPSRMINISSRALTQTGEGTHIVGFVVDGTKPKTVLIRAVGPGLTPFGLTEAVADPSLHLFNQSGTEVAMNDNWSEGGATWIADASARAGAFALAADSKDAALLINLSPGAYTAQVRAAAGSGVSLVEVYEVP